MARYGYSGDKQYRPITAWGYVGYTILFFIPIIGFIFLIIFTFHNGNINRRSFARSYWCFALIAILVYAVSFAGIVWLMKDRQGWPVSLLNGINGIRYKIIDRAC